MSRWRTVLSNAGLYSLDGTLTMQSVLIRSRGLLRSGWDPVRVKTWLKVKKTETVISSLTTNSLHCTAAADSVFSQPKVARPCLTGTVGIVKGASCLPGGAVRSLGSLPPLAGMGSRGRALVGGAFDICTTWGYWIDGKSLMGHLCFLPGALLLVSPGNS